MDAVLIGFRVLAFNATSFSACVLLAANVLVLNLGTGTANVLRGRSCAQQAYGRVLLEDLLAIHTSKWRLLRVVPE